MNALIDSEKLDNSSPPSNSRFIIRDIENNEIERKDHTDNLYVSCCGGMSDKRLVVLLTQIGISATILLFSGAMLVKGNEDNAIYMSLISSTLSYWLGKNDAEKK